MSVFDQCWLELVELEMADAVGSVQYQRMRAWWEASGEIVACLRWIKENANSPPPPMPKTTSQDAPGTTNADQCG